MPRPDDPDFHVDILCVLAADSAGLEPDQLLHRHRGRPTAGTRDARNALAAALDWTLLRTREQIADLLGATPHQIDQWIADADPTYTHNLITSTRELAPTIANQIERDELAAIEDHLWQLWREGRTECDLTTRQWRATLPALGPGPT